ncbi:MAG: putative iron-sulfur protein [Actinomycetia bacterium]|nr:putative iron-sulfur protein [Actinomycetes bacterium]
MIILAVAVLVALAALVLFTTMGRRDSGRLSAETRKKDKSDSPFLADATEQVRGREFERQSTLARTTPGTDLEPVGETAPVPYVPVDPETLGVTRRQFFNRSIIAMFGLGLSGFGAAVLAFLWPTLSGGFGSKITVGKVDDIQQAIDESKQPFYSATGRVYISPYPKVAVPKAKKSYSAAILPGMEAGYVALYQKCVHLGCRVPFCPTSQWFECGCHGSQYNRVGEKKGGPAPRGLDRFPLEVKGGSVTVDTGIVVQGPPIGVNTTGQEAEGPHCVGGGHH